MSKVKRFFEYDENGITQEAVLRVMETTCPHCKQAVQFALQEEEFEHEELEYLRKQNIRFLDEIRRLDKIINKLLNS